MGSKCFFTQGFNTVNSSVANCETEFGVPAEQLYRNIAFTNSYYGTASGAALSQRLRLQRMPSCRRAQCLVRLSARFLVCSLARSLTASVVDECGVCAPSFPPSPTACAAGADKPAGSCVLYPNGEVDPWHGLSILTSPSAGIPVLMVPGASHHAWTHPFAEDMQDSVKAAVTTIRAQVTKFLGMDCEQAAA